MRLRGWSVGLCLIFAATGSVPRTGSSAKTSPSESSNKPDPLGELRQRQQQALQYLSAGKYLEAANIYEAACPQETRYGRRQWAGWCWNNLGACRFAMFRYREALAAFLEARTNSEAAGDWANLASLNSNISSLYLQMGELDGAVRAAEQGLETLNRKQSPSAQ